MEERSEAESLGHGVELFTSITMYVTYIQTT